MSIALQHKRGLLANRPALVAGEFYYCTDTRQVFVGPTPTLVGPGSFQLVTVTLSSAQLLALSTTPITLLAAPGAGLYYFPQCYILENIFGTVAYSTPLSTNNCFINWGGQAINSANAPMSFDWGTSFIKATSSCLALGTCGNGFMSLSVAVNNSLVFGAPNALTLGNGTLKVTLAYSILSS
jgi:hypothetical protein